MNLAALKEMIAQIKKDTGLQIIKRDTTNEPPDLPYGVYTITTPYIKGRGRGSITHFEDETGDYEKRTSEYKFTISFSIYAENTETTIELAHKVHQWFLFSGEYFLQEKDIVVANVWNIENRTTFLIDEYEYKFGFDVQFRATVEQIRVMESIGAVIITN
ncbi:LIC_12616 family protein [Peribacillus sp. B-H-3]|uniref:phage neck terminator protein n=1 Tax=Peribacillus sp. B-H-3 TaxID=3400420 RepID=UPI003B02E6EB